MIGRTNVCGGGYAMAQAIAFNGVIIAYDEKVIANVSSLKFTSRKNGTCTITGCHSHQSNYQKLRILKNGTEVGYIDGGYNSIKEYSFEISKNDDITFSEMYNQPYYYSFYVSIN